jgi:hypothetical protein
MLTVALDRFLKHVGSVAGRSKALHFQRRAVVLHILANPREDLFGVLDRIALRELVFLGQDLGGVVVDQHRFRRRRATIHPDDAAHDLAGFQRLLGELGNPVLLAEGIQLWCFSSSEGARSSGVPAVSPSRDLRPVAIHSVSRSAPMKRPTSELHEGHTSPRQTPRSTAHSEEP